MNKWAMAISSPVAAAPGFVITSHGNSLQNVLDGIGVDGDIGSNVHTEQMTRDAT